MRIVFVGYHYSADVYTPQQWLERTAFYMGWLECLAKTHTVIRVDQINYEGRFEHNGVRYHCIDNGKKKRLFPRKLNRYVKSLQPDIAMVSSFTFPLQLMQLRYCLGSNVKIISQHHAEKPFSGLKRIMQKMASRQQDAGIFASMDIAKSWVQSGNLYPKMKLFEMVGGSSIFFPIDQQTAREKTGIHGAPVFLWVGRLDHNKDPLTAIKAFLNFLELQPAATLFMIYHKDDLLQDILQLIPASLLSKSITLVGTIRHDDLLYWFNSADFFISASHYEGSGTALCEAMSCGCIPVVTDIPSFRMITGDCGMRYEPGNVADLLSVLKKTMYLNIENEKSRSLSHFKNELSFEAMAGKFQQLIDDL